MTATVERAGDTRGARPPGMVVIGRRLALPMSRAALLAGVGTVLALVVASVATLSMGRLGVPLGELPTALTGGAEGKTLFVLDRLRGPRLVVAIAAGAAFGISGALFQSVTRNPLGSPDVIGLGAGAGAGAAVVALKMPEGVPVSLGALIGAAAAITLVYFATGSGFRDPGRLIVAGIGVAAIAIAITQYVVYAVERERATALTAYVNGSLAARSWDDAREIGLALLVLLPLTLAMARRLDIGEMGDEIAAALGAEPKRTRARAVLLSVLLSAAAISVAGPIAFIALTAPQIARRLTGGWGAHLVLSALLGSLLLVLADLAAQQLPMDDMPVGIYTMAIGGIYLGYLLTREWRRGRL
ncbi:iron chelate uptake ABC transporter family permease subunit [Streptomyces sp. 3MP-14]|uniref:Iron chelate uptake ABC transporter family permease subunit n=1 Tax=Streptomyces mimosae TaxID=2586635 RepID=A0A5N6A0A0_9ACTN|nr:MULTISPECIES: iron chelate uptake ABC transporter family permease subunit [Streptomyces]KAB8162174.1 iron chelate uptake ABC transporter family permease subunit [Streptomyces mimosae]KAB8173928.1 iron chelate uptake ABC transporter family permease subunit [Streptomyces sp. 3MP-14]